MDASLNGIFARQQPFQISLIIQHGDSLEGAQLFEKINGDYFAVLGLPLLGLLAALRAHGGLAR